MVMIWKRETKEMQRITVVFYKCFWAKSEDGFFLFRKTNLTRKRIDDDGRRYSMFVFFFFFSLLVDEASLGYILRYVE